MVYRKTTRSEGMANPDYDGGTPNKWESPNMVKTGGNPSSLYGKQEVETMPTQQSSPPPVLNRNRPTYNQSTPGNFNFNYQNVSTPDFMGSRDRAEVGFNAPDVPQQFHHASQYAPQGWDNPALREGWKPPTWEGFNAQDFQEYKDPGYDYRLAQGQQAMMRQAAAGSGAFGGATGKALVRYGQQQGANEFAAARNRAMQDYQTGLNRAQLDRQVSQQDYQNQLQQNLYDRQFGQQDFMNQQGIADRRNQFGQQQFTNQFNNSAQEMQAQQQTFQNFNNVNQQQNQFNQQNYQNQVTAEDQRRRRSLEEYKIAEARAVQNRAFNMQDLAQENAARAAEFAQLSGMSNAGLQATGQTISGGNQATAGGAQANTQVGDAAGSGAMGAANAAVQGYQHSYNAWRDQAAMSAQMSAGLMGMAGTIIGAAIM